MISFHLLYTLNDQFHDETKDFASFEEAESWLTERGASYWEIGVPDGNIAELERVLTRPTTT